MARIRTIKPDFFKSHVVVSLPLSARLTFIGLWCYVDDDGRGKDDARLIKAEVWPLDDKHTPAKVRKDLDLLCELGLMARYGPGLLVVTNFREHQRVNNPTPSKYPPPPDPLPDFSHSPTVGLPESYPLEGKGKERKGKESPPARRWTPEADSIAKAEWERRDAKPVCGFVAFRERISEALEAGHDARRVAAVLPSMSVFSRNSFDLALGQRAAKAGRVEAGFGVLRDVVAGS